MDTGLAYKVRGRASLPTRKSAFVAAVSLREGLPVDLFIPDGRFAFQPGELKTTGAPQELPSFSLSTYIQLNKASTDILDVSWLAQANACVGPAISDGKKMHGKGTTMSILSCTNAVS